jgi:hypothetical protein
MLLLNFSHPLTADHLARLEGLIGQPIERVIDVPRFAQIDATQPIEPQIATLIDRAALTPAEWQTTPLIINPPSLNYSALALIAALHGRMGYFPACVRLRPVPNALPPQFEVAEVLNLQAMREAARKTR